MKHLEESPEFRQTLRRMKPLTFTRLDTLPKIDSGGPFLVGLNVRHCTYDQVQIMDPIDLGMLKIHYLSAFNLQFGYLLETPRLVLTTEPEYVSIVRPEFRKAERFSGVTVLHANKHFTVMSAADQAILVSLTIRQLEET